MKLFSRKTRHPAVQVQSLRFDVNLFSLYLNACHTKTQPRAQILAVKQLEATKAAVELAQAHERLALFEAMMVRAKAAKPPQPEPCPGPVSHGPEPAAVEAVVLGQSSPALQCLHGGPEPAAVQVGELRPEAGAGDV